MIRQQMGKRFVDSKALRSGFIIVFITVSRPQTFTSKRVGKYSMYRKIRDKDTPTNSHQTPSEKVQEARVVGFQHHPIVRSLESGYLFFPLLLVIFLGKPLESLEIQHSVFSSRCNIHWAYHSCHSTMLHLEAVTAVSLTALHCPLHTNTPHSLRQFAISTRRLSNKCN